jgi:hypothetical protein
MLYGSPTDWKDVAGCLSRTHRRDVRDHFGIGIDDDIDHYQTHLPLNPDVVWNWSRYSSSHSIMPSDDGENGDDNASSTNHTDVKATSIPRRRLLIAQFSGKGSYEKLLREVEPINRAYAKRWGHDYTTLVGTALKFPGLVYQTSQGDDNESRDNHRYCRYYNTNDNANSLLHSTNSSSTPRSASSSYYNYEAQSTFNKIPLLFKAMEESPLKYDQVLILDSDTMIVDFEYDITSLMLSSNPANQDYGDGKIRENNQLDNNERAKKSDLINDGAYNHDVSDDSSYFLVAYRVWKFDWLSTWDINAGITLWNLQHPNTRRVAEEWLKSSLSDPKEVLLKNDDQYYLQRALQKVTASNAFVGGDQKNSAIGTFGMSSFRKWWKRHSDHVKDGVGIRAVRDEFEYYNATVIKHFKRDTASWSQTGLEQRLLCIREVKAEICRLWPTDC